ncbi:polysaccharide pyruvyl transferase family protein [Rhodococcoides fascians]|uniref:polysaccharide pyruvyl transferase family protein n=1 Tax=Rhodococcoides fascians TaxID=1828 RepID=UPI000B1A5544|nr:polysaccharide pyruvyl transferase family protein [Rhodococcus fascians]
MEERKNIRVLILWADPRAENLGLQALAGGARSAVQQIWGGCDVVFHTHNTQNTPLTRAAMIRDLCRRPGGMTAFFRDFDLILDTGGGDSFTDIYGLRRLLLMKYVRIAAGKACRPVVMTPQTIGPFKTWVGKRVATSMLRKSTLVCTRDPESSRNSRILGRDADVESTDMAFALSKPDRGDLYDVVLNVSGLLWNENPHVDYRSYRTNVLKLIDELMLAGRRVSLLAHVLDSPLADNDVPAVKSAAAASKSDVEILVPADLADVRSILANSAVLIGSRMHSAINALAVGTVAIPWSYSRKFAPLMESIGWHTTIDLSMCDDPVGETLRMLERSVFLELQGTVASATSEAENKIRAFTEASQWTSITDAVYGASVC